MFRLLPRLLPTPPLKSLKPLSSLSSKPKFSYFSTSTQPPISEADALYLGERGITSPQIQTILLRTLQKSGTTLKTFPAGGLKQLAESIEKSLPPPSTDSITINVYVPHHSTSFILEGCPSGTTLTSLPDNPSNPQFEMIKEYLPLSCGGNMSCSTCHVLIPDAVDYQRCLEAGGLDVVSEAENDMLDLAFGFVEGQSRLGCQCIIPKGEGITVQVPSGVNDFWS